MARGRMLSQKIAEDIDFNGMSIDAQFLFMRTIPFLDRDGLVVGHPGLLWSKIAPLLTQYTSTTASAIEEWISAGFVTKYMDGKTPVLFFKGFAKNQSLTHYDREAPSSFAPPPGYYRTPKGLKPLDDDDNGGPNPQTPEKPKSSDSGEARNSSDNVSARLRTNSGLTPDQIPVKGIEVEENRTTTTRAREAERPPEHSGESSGGSGGGLPKHRNRQTDQDYARLCTKFENEGFGTLTQIMGEDINALLNEYPVDWIDEAMTVAVQANKRQLRYVRGILVKWRSDGRSDKKQAQNGQAPPQALTLKQWCMKHYHTDNPKFVSVVPEATIYEQYNQYRNQQAH